jgi:hypothetical protein
MLGSTDRSVAGVEDPCGCTGIGSTNYENVIEPCRALSRRDPVNLVVVRPNRHGSLANRAEFLPAQRHGHGAGAKGEAATAATADGKLRCSSSERAGRPDDGSNSGRDAVGCAGSGHGEACQAGERGQQLQRWLRIKLPTRQGPLGWMQRIRGVLLGFLGNLQGHTHSQGLRAMRGDQDVPGLGPKSVVVVLHRHAEWRKISGHRGESKQVAHARRGFLADS